MPPRERVKRIIDRGVAEYEEDRDLDSEDKLGFCGWCAGVFDADELVGDLCTDCFEEAQTINGDT